MLTAIFPPGTARIVAVGGGSGTVTVDAPGVRIRLKGAAARAEGDLVRITVKGPRP